MTWHDFVILTNQLYKINSYIYQGNVYLKNYRKAGHHGEQLR